MKQFLCALLALLLILPLLPAVQASGAAPVEIHTVEDLLAMAEDPGGSYILMNDLDMTGTPWKSLDFSGSFDGNGHAILNLTISQPGDATPDSYDGNKIAYETTYFGFFGTLLDAQVKNLQLRNVRAVIESDSPVFLAGIAGYCLNSTISGCTVTGCLELRAHDRMFGVGGVIGYGSGTIEDCTVDMTLICVDTDAATKDEQFLGGVCATGFVDILKCDITIHGYVSEHGYVHCGGAVGMYMEYPHGVGRAGHVKNNRVTGKITFFEDNNNRRAYCSAYLGEALVCNCAMSGNVQDFKRDERWTYDKELRPETCEAPVYTETLIPSGCDSYGYTLYTCDGCGWSYTDHYTLFSHSVTEWTEILAPTTEAEGILSGCCDGCGLEFRQAIEKLKPEPTVTEAPTESAPTEARPLPTEPDATATEPPVSTEEPSPFPWPVVAAVLIAAAAVFALLCLRRPKPGKYQRKK